MAKPWVLSQVWTLDQATPRRAPCEQPFSDGSYNRGEDYEIRER